MTDQTTPPLDLPAHDALHPTLAEAVARGDAAYGAGGDAEAVTLAAAAPLLARAEAAEAKVAAVREVHAKEKHGVQHHCGECLQDDNTGSWEYVEWPCPTIAALGEAE